jgi:hypothetical protein
VPTGRNGFQPQLSLAYSTGNGNGPMGLGWALSVPGVSRKTSIGIPRYDDSSDVFILSGAEDLVPVRFGSAGATSYRPRTEGLFARITHYREGQNDYWEVKSKDGLVSTYGTPGLAGSDPAVVAHPDHRSRIFAWRLTLTTDPFGNRIEYSYDRDAVRTDGPHHWDQLYLSEIRYVDYGDPAHPQFLVKVRFIYDGPMWRPGQSPLPPKTRPDPFSDYRAGFEIRTVRRCTQIDVLTEAGSETLVRSYHLLYQDQLGEPPRNAASLLSRIVVEGHDGASSELLPLLEFGYTDFQADRQKFAAIRGADLPAKSLADPSAELVDLFGQGLPDILEMNGTARYWRNRGDGTFDIPRPMDDAPGGLGLADPGVQLLDANGDGKADLFITTERLSGYYPMRFGGLWDSRSFQRYRQAPSFNLKDPEVHLVDLDGDGVTDAMRSGTSLECYFNDPLGGWSSARRFPRKQLSEFPDVDFSDPRVKWADMTGDGLQDIALVYDGTVQYWPNLGYGDWGQRVTMAGHSPRFPYGYDPKRILLGDVDGDGLADIVYVDNRRITLWINQAGNGWSAPIVIEGTPPVSDMDAVRLADVGGNGISGILWTSDLTEVGRAHMFFLDLTGGAKPYLLGQMNNHMGSVTSVEYAPSTRFYLEDEKQLVTRWKTPLPIPVHVVSRVEVIDEISQGKLTTGYRYHHGYWDGVEREFRGFGMVEQYDSEEFATYHKAGSGKGSASFLPVSEGFFSPPTLTKSWFHQGAIGDEFPDWYETDYSDEFWIGDGLLLSRPADMAQWLKTLPRRVRRDAFRALRGHLLRSELYAADGSGLETRPYTVTEHLYGLREEDQPSSSQPNRLHLFFPYLLAQRTTQWERGYDPMAQFTFSDDFDDYGQPRRQTQVACPRGWRHPEDMPTDPYLATRTLTVYASPSASGPYIFDRVARASTYEYRPATNAPSRKLFDLRDLPDDSPDFKLIGQTLNFYDRDTR